MKTSLIYVITGAGRGIGLELTRQVLSAGHTVITGVRNPDAATELRSLASQFEERLSVHKLDVSSDQSVEAFAHALKLDHIDVLINNAGIYLDDDDRVESVTAKTVSDTFNTNTLGPLRMSQSLLPLLKRSSAPRVINITSQMGSIADNSSGSSVAYRVSKAALNMVTKSLANEEPKIVSLMLHPGWVQTSMGGTGAPVSAEDSAKGILKLIDDAKPKDSGKFLNYTGKELPF